MPALSTPTQALDAQRDEQHRQSPQPVQPAPLEHIAQGGFGQRFSFAGAPGATANGGTASQATATGATATGGAQEPSPPTLDLPRVQTDVERPQRNQERRNLQTLVQALGAAGAVAGAAGDSTLMTSIGAGLTEGAGQAQRRSEEQFQKRLRGYEQFVRDARQANRQLRRAEAEAEYEAALADYKLDRQRQQAGRQFQRKKELERLRAELDEPSDMEKAVTRAKRDYYEAGADKRRAGARENLLDAEAAAALAEKRRRTGGEEGEDRPSMDKLNRQLVETGRAMSTTATQLEAARQKLSEMENGEMVETDSRRDLVQDRIGRLQEKLDGLQREQARITAQINQRGGAEGEVAARGTGGGGQPGGDQQSRSQGRGDGGQSESDPIRQAARQQAAKMDTVTQADIGAAVQQFGVGSDEVRILREVRRIQQSQ